MTSETKSNESTNYEYLYTNIHLLFRHTNIGPSIDINNFELFKKYLQKVGNTNLDSTIDINSKLSNSDSIKLCLENLIIKLNDETNLDDNAIMNELTITISQIQAMNTSDLDKIIKYVLDEIISTLTKIEKDEETLYFIEHKFFTLKEHINDNILKCLSYIDKLQELNYQWVNNIKILKDIFIIIKEGTSSDEDSSSDDKTKSISKSSTDIANQPKSASKINSLNPAITSNAISSSAISSNAITTSAVTSAITSAIIASTATSSTVPGTIRGGLKMSDFEYIKYSIKLKISLIKPKQKILYQ